MTGRVLLVFAIAAAAAIARCVRPARRRSTRPRLRRPVRSSARTISRTRSPSTMRPTSASSTRKSYKVVTVSEAYGGRTAGTLRARPMRHAGAGAVQQIGADAQSSRCQSAPSIRVQRRRLRRSCDLGATGGPDRRVATARSHRRRRPERAASGQVREFAAAGVIDAELVVAGRPSVLMTGGSAIRRWPPSAAPAFRSSPTPNGSSRRRSRAPSG